MFSNFFFLVRKSCRLWDNAEKHDGVRRASYDNIIRRMRIARWITDATDAHSEYVTLISIPLQIGYANACLPYIICIPPIFLRTIVMPTCAYAVKCFLRHTTDVQARSHSVKTSWRHHKRVFFTPGTRVFNLLKPTGYVMHQQFNIQQLYVLPTLYLCVLYLSENKQPLVPLTA